MDTKHWITESGEAYQDKLQRLKQESLHFRHTTPEERHEIRCLARDGVPNNVLAQEFRLSIQTIQKIIKHGHKTD